MDNNINSVYGNIRINQTQEHGEQSVHQSDVQPREYSDQMHYDPNEYLGRSQVIQRNIQPKTDNGYKELSDEEFEALKKKIEQNPIYRKVFDKIQLNKFNIQVVNKILSDERLFNNSNVMDNAGDIIWATQNPKQEKIVNKILSDERFFNNSNFMSCAGDIIRTTQTPEQVKIVNKILSDEILFNNRNVMFYAGAIIRDTQTPEQVKIVNKILSDERLFNNGNFMFCAGAIIRTTQNPEQEKAKSDIIDKILSEERLFNNSNFMYYAGDIIRDTQTPEQEKAKCDIIDKILSDERLFNKRNVMDNAGDIIRDTQTPEQVKIVNKILSDERLFNTRNVMDNAGAIIRDTQTPEQVKIVNKILSDERLFNNGNVMDNAVAIIRNTQTPEQEKIANKILSDERLFNNRNVMANAGAIIRNTQTPEQVKVKCDIIDKILSDERLFNNRNVMDNAVGIIRKTQTPEQVKVKYDIIDKILSDERLFNNKNFMYYADDIIRDTQTPEQEKIANKILSDERLFNNRNVMANAGAIIRDTQTPEQVKVKCDIIDKILSDERLFNNKKFIESAGHIIYNTNTPEQAKAKYDIIDKYLSDEKLINDDVISDNLGFLIKNSNKNTTMKTWADFSKLLNSAFDKKDQLKAANSDISNEIIKEELLNSHTLNAIDILGVPVLEASFHSKLDGVKELMMKANYLEKNLSKNKLEELKQKINPEGTTKYKQLQEEITELKKSYPQVKAQGDKEALIELQKQIATKTKEAQNIIKNSCKLSPQAVIEKVKVLYAIAHTDTNDVQKFLDLIKEPTKENEAAWKNEVNKYIFTSLGFEFDKSVSDRLNLEKSPYISEILSGNRDFKENFKEILQLLKDNPTKDIKDIFDELPQNKATKEMFEKIGINYNKYCSVDENLNVDITVTTSADKAKKSAIEALEKEFNDPAYLALPQEERDKLAKKIKEKANVDLTEKQETVFDEDGYAEGTKTVFRLYEDGEPVKFESLKKIIRAIREELNSNEFWTVTSDDSTLDSYKKTMYTHFTKDRDTQINNAKDLKEDKVATLTIKKTDMNDIKHSLFLGNQGACCTSVGSGCNQYSAPTYVKNKMVSAIEVVDGDNFVGNTMCWIAEIDGVPSLVLDNIELKSEYHNNDSIRDAILEYAKRMCEEIGKPDMPIYAGPNRHKLNMEVYPKATHNLKIIGNTGDDEIYLDYMTDGKTIDGTDTDEVVLYKMR